MIKFNGKTYGLTAKGITKGSAASLCGGKTPSMGCYVETTSGAVYNLSGSFYLWP